MKKFQTRYLLEKNPAILRLIKLVLENNLKTASIFPAWESFFSRYVDPVKIHRKKNINEFEAIFQSTFFEILFSIHTFFYAFVRFFLIKKSLPISLKILLFENIYESAFNCLSSQTKVELDSFFETEFSLLNKASKPIHKYEFFETVYRSLFPKGFRTPLGEFFTPLSLAKKMVADVERPNEKRWIENASGFGVFLFAYIETARPTTLDSFISIEANPLSAFVAKAILALEYETLIPENGTIPIYWGDSLANERYVIEGQNISVAGTFTSIFDSFDVAIGNPPWVSWKSMTKSYQDLIGDGWRSYGIFETKITRQNLGACNDDISSYFVYYTMDKFLKNNGLLKFLINLSLFKSNLVGKGFRKFEISKDQTHFQIKRIFDLSGTRAFKGVNNAYCYFDAEKGNKNMFPIPYFVLSENQQGFFVSQETSASPVNGEKIGALKTNASSDFEHNEIEGLCEYKGRAGVCTWLNSVYWVKIENPENPVLIKNLAESGKKKVPEVIAEVEKALLFRLLRARNLRDFTPEIENHIVVPQVEAEFSRPIPMALMEQEFPKGLHFFSHFKKELLERSGYRKFLNNQPFYGLYNIGPYTKAPIKIAWQFVSKQFRVFYINNASDIIPDLNVMFIPIYDETEGYYLHALLNSKYAKHAIESSSNWTFPSGSIQKIYLEKFDQSNPLHSKISALQKTLLSSSISQSEEMDELFQSYWFKKTKKTSEIPSQLSLW